MFYFKVLFATVLLLGAVEASAEDTAPAEAAEQLGTPSAPTEVTGPTAEAPAPQTDAAGPVGEFGDIAGSLDDLLQLSMQEERNVSVQAASKYAQYTRRTPASVVVISRQEIRQHKYRSIPEALQSVSGFYVYNDTLYDFVNVRGLGLPGDFNTRVLLLLNGHTLNVSAGSGGANLHDFHLDMQSVERIEVIRGPGSVVYGTGAFFAVVNVITAAPESANSNFASIGGGIPDAIGEASLNHGGRSGDLWWQVLSRGYADNGVERFFPEHDAVSAEDRDRAAGAYGRLGWKDVTFSLYAASRNKQEPSAQFETMFNVKGNRAEDQRYFAELMYQKAWETLRLTARTYGDYGNWQDYLIYDDGIYRDLIEDRKAGAEVRGVWRLGDHELLTGVEGNRHAAAMPSGYRDDFRLQVADPNRIYYSSLNVYAQESWHVWEPMLLVGGAQLSTHSLYKSAVSPRAGILMFPTETQVVKLMYSAGIRQPTAFERFFEDNTDFIGNPDLKPEYLQTGELSYEFYPVDDLRVYAGTFLNQYRDIIAAVQVPFGPDEERNQFLNEGRVRSAGGELTFEARLPGEWIGQVGGTFQRVTQLETGKTPDGSPRWLGNLAARGPLGQNLGLGVDAHYVGSRRMADESAAANPYWLVNATLSSARYWDRLETSLRVRNLLNVKYEELVSADHWPETTIEQRPLTAVLRLDYYY